MKRTGILAMAALMLGIGTLNTGCMGSFGLTKSLYGWNDGATGNRFVDNLLFYLLAGSQIYSLCLFGDIVVFNLIEFWSGSNPVSMKEGETEQQTVKGKDGNTYELTATRNRFEILQLTGEQKGSRTVLSYDPAKMAWSKTDNAGETRTFAVAHPEINKVEVFAMDGSMHLIDMNAMQMNAVLSN